MTVYLVGAGPGDPELLTVRAADLLARADAVVHDRLVDERVLALARSAERHSVGKHPGGGWRQQDINDLLIRLGRRFDVVVRLKGGDPYVFGRGGEEAIAVASAGLTVDVVPGVTSAFAAPLAAGIPVTHRGVSSSVTVVTARREDGTLADLRGLAGPGRTLVILMGASARDEVVTQLLSDGIDPATPVAAVESAWTPRQRVLRGRLVELGALPIRPPVTIVVGDAAAMSAVGAPQRARVDSGALVLASR